MALQIKTARTMRQLSRHAGTSLAVSTASPPSEPRFSTTRNVSKQMPIGVDGIIAVQENTSKALIHVVFMSHDSGRVCEISRISNLHQTQLGNYGMVYESVICCINAG